MVYTGLEHLTLNDLERKAYADGNTLAIELCQRTGNKKRRLDLCHVRTNYTDGTRWLGGKFFAPKPVEA